MSAGTRAGGPAADVETASAFRAVQANGTLGGPINGHALNDMVKKAAAAAGYDPGPFGGHPLPAGFVIQAFRSGATAHSIMPQTGHRDFRTLEI